MRCFDIPGREEGQAIGLINMSPCSIPLHPALSRFEIPARNIFADGSPLPVSSGQLDT